MVRSNRIKNLPINLTAASTGYLTAQYSDNPINGTIQKVELTSTNFASTGSLWVDISGTNERILGKFTGNDAVWQQYPVVFAVDNTATTGSPYIAQQRVINNLFCVTGSGLGNAKSGTINVCYI